tara:strand:- start:472 stop:666 length:195 start_codon:yes stop_codon:yes gene_type:complete
VEGLRFAGDLGHDFSESIFSDLRHLVRRNSKYRLDKDFFEMSPENSEPEYTLTGRYQPEVTYGR